ncbi:acyl-CoA dehydrogenase family protein [Actinokineospora sp. PR83]|uniref:acyl-CoA dehydrogenase family protein n=1 Tax=Actinokineospora sp. PR83 TaxID=2884908 RepID=UPI0027E01DCA|nr:acyl-CoA dehydrogenase family protein [Actinokineospora sp. PR83]MCG8917253.1 acyl-CoA dehydrogenase family protein [Actinokineospora sp. PR83]
MTTTLPAPTTTEHPDWSERPTTPDGWVARAHEVAGVISEGAAERDRSHRTPHAEIQVVKDSGLATLLGPAEHGGGGQEWPTAYRVVRAIGAADGSIGQLVGDHFTWCWLPRMVGTAEQIERIERDAARGNWFFGCALNPRDADVVATDEGDHLVFSGKKSFCTGVKVSDHTVLEGVLDNGDHVIGVVPTDQPGIVYHDNWDNMGQRLTDSGGVSISDVRVPWEDALGFTDKKFQPHPYMTMNIPIGQLLFANLWLGVANGALNAAIDYTQGKRGWGGYDRTVDEPRVQDTIGDLTAKVWAAEAFADQVAQEGLALHRDRLSVTPRMRGEYKVRTAAVKTRADEVALEVTSRIFEVTGARSTANSFGFDRFWRNVRTHTLHHPVAYQRREVGLFRLLDEVPEPARYS